MNILSRNIRIRGQKTKKSNKSKKTKVIVVPKWLTQYIRTLTLVFLAIFYITFLLVGFALPVVIFSILIVVDMSNSWPYWNLLLIIFLSIFWYSAFYLITKNKGMLDW